MRKLLCVLALTVTSSVALAQDDYLSRSTANNLLLNAGMNRGGLTFGAAYEYMYDQGQGIGGLFRYFSKKDSRAADGLVILGGMTGFHFYKKTWDFALTPSINIIQIDSAQRNISDTTTLGPGLSISLTNQLNDKVAIGFDYSNFWAWFSEDFAGQRIGDMSFRVKVSF